MLPRLSPNDLVDAGAIHAVSLSKLIMVSASSSQLANGQNLGFGKFGARMVGPMRNKVSRRGNAIAVGNASPGSTFDNVRDTAPGDVVLVSQLLNRNITLSIAVQNTKNIGGAQFVFAGKLARAVNLSTLGNAIGNIVGLSACKKMRGVAAWRIVTVMKHFFSRAKRLKRMVGQFPRYNMSWRFLSCLTNPAIATSSWLQSAWPAFSRLAHSNTFPEFLGMLKIIHPSHNMTVTGLFL